MLPPTGMMRALLAAVVIAVCAACATVPPVQQAFALGQDGAVVGRSLQCTGDAAALARWEALEQRRGATASATTE